MIKNNGQILNLVPDLYIAWHAGKSKWKDYKSLNRYSIGIEISNPGHNFKYQKFSNKQIQSIVKLSKILKKASFYTSKGSRRDIFQVYANGGIALLICIVSHFINDSILVYLFFSSVAAAMSDTWGTEFGKISKSKPRSIISMKSINHGESGGVTLIGTFASLLGSCIIGFSTYLLFGISTKQVIIIIMSVTFNNHGRKK